MITDCEKCHKKTRMSDKQSFLAEGQRVSSLDKVVRKSPSGDKTF